MDNGASCSPRPPGFPTPRPRRGLTWSPGRGGRQPAQVDLILIHRPPSPAAQLPLGTKLNFPGSLLFFLLLLPLFFFSPFLPPPSLFLRAGLAPPPSGTAGRSAPRPPLNTGGGSAARPSAGWERRGGSRPALQPALQPSGRPPALRHPASHRRRCAASPLRPRRAPRLPAERPPLPP